MRNWRPGGKASAKMQKKLSCALNWAVECLPTEPRIHSKGNGWPHNALYGHRIPLAGINAVTSHIFFSAFGIRLVYSKCPLAVKCKAKAEFLSTRLETKASL